LASSVSGRFSRDFFSHFTAGNASFDKSKLPVKFVYGTVDQNIDQLLHFHVIGCFKFQLVFLYQVMTT
jgi:hypothetical protein